MAEDSEDAEDGIGFSLAAGVRVEVEDCMRDASSLFLGADRLTG